MAPRPPKLLRTGSNSCRTSKPTPILPYGRTGGITGGWLNMDIGQLVLLILAPDKNHCNELRQMAD